VANPFFPLCSAKEETSDKDLLARSHGGASHNKEKKMAQIL